MSCLVLRSRRSRRADEGDVGLRETVEASSLEVLGVSTLNHVEKHALLKLVSSPATDPSRAPRRHVGPAHSFF